MTTKKKNLRTAAKFTKPKPHFCPAKFLCALRDRELGGGESPSIPPPLKFFPLSLIHPVVLKKSFERSQRFDCNVLHAFENFGYIFMSQNDDESQNQLFNHILYSNRLANHISFILYMCVMQPIEFCNLLTAIRSTTDHL